MSVDGKGRALQTSSGAVARATLTALRRREEPNALCWPRAHNKHLVGACFEGPTRICLSGEVDATGVLHTKVRAGSTFVHGAADGRVSLDSTWVSGLGTAGNSRRPKLSPDLCRAAVLTPEPAWSTIGATPTALPSGR